MKISNLERLTNRNPIPNQFVIVESGKEKKRTFDYKITFLSWETVIAVQIIHYSKIKTILDEKYWNYTTTTAKYRDIFLDSTPTITLKNIKSGIYKLKNLNK